MAARLVEPFMTYNDANGVPLAGGKLRFFVSGTVSTDKDTFSDDTLLTENPNPIILDAAGRVPNTVVDVWGDGEYKLVVADSSDVDIETFDPVSGSFAATRIANIAALTALLKSTLTDGDELVVSGFTTQGDGGEGRLYWDASSTETENLITVFESDEGGTGRWKRMDFDFPTPEMAGAAGSADDTTALTNFFAYLATSGKMGSLKEGTTYLYDSTTGAHVSSSAQPMRFTTFGKAAIIKLVNTKLTKFLDMTTLTSGHITNVIFDGNNLTGFMLNLRNSSGTDLDGSLYVKDVSIINTTETTQGVGAHGIYGLGRFRNITYDNVTIPSLDRVSTGIPTQALVAEKTTGTVLIQNCNIGPVGTPEDENADAIAVFGAENGSSVNFDAGSVLVTNNYLSDFEGRGVKGQHTNMRVIANHFSISDGLVTITNWQAVDLQMANGTVTENKLEYGSGITKQGGGSNSAIFCQFQNTKATDKRQSSICANNNISARTKIPNAVVNIVAGGVAATDTYITIEGNNFGNVDAICKHVGLDAAIGGSCSYYISDNIVESFGFGFQASEVTYLKLFVAFVDNINIETTTLNFRESIRQDTPTDFDIGTNFVLADNKGFQDLVEWQFNADNLHNGNRFMSNQANSNDPGAISGDAYWTTQYNKQVVTNTAGTINYQRTTSTLNSSAWNAWKTGPTYT